jgi:hypothetical protein
MSMGWLIGGAMLICCIGVPMLVLAVRKRRTNSPRRRDAREKR